MFKKFFILFSLLFVLNTVTSNSEITEIQTIEDYSKQFLIDLENNLEVDETKNTNEPSEKTVQNGEEVIDIDHSLYIDDNEIPVEDNSEQKENFISETGNNEIKKINWTLQDNFRAAIIGDLDGNIFFSRNADKFYPLASVTKVMSLMVTFDAIRNKEVSLNDKVKITKDIASIGGSGIPMKSGSVFLLSDLIKASAIYSANNATYAIAKHVGKGKVSAFVDRMNKKAKALKLDKELKYYTPAGLPTRMTKKPMDSGTARGVYKLSIEALEYKEYIKIAGTKNTKIYNNKISIRNRNNILGEKGIYGIKTGFHNEAKYNITIASKYNNMDTITVVMGGNSYKSRDNTVLNILDIFHENYEKIQVTDKNISLGKLQVPNTEIYVNAYPKDNFYKIAQKDKSFNIKLHVRNNLKLNIYVGEKIGTYEVYEDDNLIHTGDLISKEAIK